MLKRIIPLIVFSFFVALVIPVVSLSPLSASAQQTQTGPLAGTVSLPAGATGVTAGSCASNTILATGAYVATCGGGSLPSAPSIGAVPTSTGAGTTYTGQIPLGGTTWYYPVEWYGAVGDATGAAGVGTNNTTAIQNCLNAVATAGQGQCLLQAKKYRITAPLTIGVSSVGIAGYSYGAFSTATSNQLKGNVPVSALVIDSATSDAIDASGGAIGTPISFNRFNDFTIIRTQADTGVGTGCATIGGHAGAAGLSIQYAGGFVVNHVWSEDSACPFYFYNAGAYGTGSVENSGALWAANGFNPVVPIYGFFVNGSQSAESFRLRDSFAQTLYPGYSGVQSTGLLVTGPELNDIMVSRFETAFVTYGEYFQYTGSGNAVSGSDIHLLENINDTFFSAGIVISGLTNPLSGAVEINGGWDTTNASGAAGVEILNSSGVMVSNVEFGNNGSQGYGVLASGSSNLAITGNRFLNQSTNAISLATISDSTVTGNVMNAISGHATSTFIAGTSLTYTSITGNSLGGYCSTAGISLDSASNNNTLLNAVDTANCTVAIINSGSGNQISGSATWPPSAAGPTFSPAAGSISSGTTVTTTCTGGTPYISAGTSAIAGGTGIVVSAPITLYGSCQGSGYFTTGSAAYTVTGGTTTYVNTTFNEASSGNLAGTTPTTCANSCVPPWTLTAGTDFTYTGSNSITTSTSNISNQYDYINASTAELTTAVVRFNLSGCAGVCQFVFRDAGGNNYLALNCTSTSGGTCQMYDGPSFGTVGSAITGTVTGSYTVTFSGSAVTLATPNGSTSATTANTGTAFGFDLTGVGASLMTLTSYSIKSN